MLNRSKLFQIAAYASAIFIFVITAVVVIEITFNTHSTPSAINKQIKTSVPVTISTSTPEPTNKPEFVCLADFGSKKSINLNVNFDATTTIPGTSIEISYPKDGFFGCGNKISQEINEDVCPTIPTKYFYLYSQSDETGSPRAHVRVTVEVLNQPVTNPLEDFVSKNDYEQTRPYSTAGKFKTINGKKYYTFQGTDGEYFAYTTGKDGLITIGIRPSYQATYWWKETPAEHWWVDHPDLFDDIIAHINFNSNLDYSVPKIIIPTNVFDASVEIPGSNALLFYPSRGFYGSGVKIFYNNDPDRFLYGPGFEGENKPQSVRISSLEAAFVRKLKEGETLKTFIDKYDDDTMDGVYRRSGRYETVNGINYLYYLFAEDTVSWNAYIESGGTVVKIKYSWRGDSCYDSRLKDISELFHEIMTKVRFK